MLLGADGEPVLTKVSTLDRCPKCGSKDKRETFNGFGGHKQDLCTFCGYDYLRGVE